MKGLHTIFRKVDENTKGTRLTELRSREPLISSRVLLYYNLVFDNQQPYRTNIILHCKTINKPFTLTSLLSENFPPELVDFLRGQYRK